MDPCRVGPCSVGLLLTQGVGGAGCLSFLLFLSSSARCGCLPSRVLACPPAAQQAHPVVTCGCCLEDLCTSLQEQRKQTPSTGGAGSQKQVLPSAVCPGATDAQLERAFPVAFLAALCLNEQPLEGLRPALGHQVVWFLNEWSWSHPPVCFPLSAGNF